MCEHKHYWTSRIYQYGEKDGGSMHLTEDPYRERPLVFPEKGSNEATE